MQSTINVTLTTSTGDEDPTGTAPSKYYRMTISKISIISNYLGLVIPILVSFYYGWIRRQRYLLLLIRKQISEVDFDIFSNKGIVSSLSVGNFLQVSSYNLLTRLLGKTKEDKEPKKETLSTPEKSVCCEILHDPGPDKRQADIIFIHGLKGAVEKTWTQGLWRHTKYHVKNLRASDETWEVKIDGGNQETSSTCWPRDWLPMDCPDVRVIAVNYTTDPYLWRPFWISKRCRTPMPERSWEMMSNLTDLDVGSRSIIWVGHSKGGLYVKQMLVHACETSIDKYKTLKEKTKGVLFYSVPHRGSPLANLNLPLLRQSVELTEVQKNCPEVLALHQKFVELLNKKQLSLSVKSFIETKLTLMSFLYVRIVSEESADANVGELYGVPLDHRNICKPKSRACILYRELVNLIKSICENMGM